MNSNFTSYMYIVLWKLTVIKSDFNYCPIILKLEYLSIQSRGRSVGVLMYNLFCRILYFSNESISMVLMESSFYNRQ